MLQSCGILHHSCHPAQHRAEAAVEAPKGTQQTPLSIMLKRVCCVFQQTPLASRGEADCAPTLPRASAVETSTYGTMPNGFNSFVGLLVHLHCSDNTGVLRLQASTALMASLSSWT